MNAVKAVVQIDSKVINEAIAKHIIERNDMLLDQANALSNLYIAMTELEIQIKNPVCDEYIDRIHSLGRRLSTREATDEEIDEYSRLNKNRAEIVAQLEVKRMRLLARIKGEELRYDAMKTVVIGNER